MQDIENKARATYQENLAYLKQYHNYLHEKLMLLENAIADGTFSEHYSLEYKNEGYFDVLSVESEEYLYGSNSRDYANKIIDSVDFSRENGVFEAQRYVDFSPEMPDIIDQSKLHLNNGLWATIKIIEYTKKIAARETTQMKAVYKLLFLGIGLGTHIAGVVEKMGAKIIFLKENNLELFRLSLFVTNYARLSKKVTLFISIMENEIRLKETFIAFLEKGNNYNLYMKQISMTAEYEKELFNYQNFTMYQEYIIYPYNAFLLRYLDSPRYIVAEYPFLNVYNRYQDNFLSTKPFLFLFSGPSTAHNIEWIKENKEYFIIVTAMSTCKYLNREGIKPDIVIHVDPDEVACLPLLDDIPEEFFEGTICLFSSNLPIKIVEHFRPEQIYFIQQDGNYKFNFGALSAPSVGEFSYALFLRLGVQEIYLLGINLALDPDTLASHSPGHHLGHVAREGNEDRGSLELSMMEVPGNFLNKVPTYPMYKVSIDEFARMSQLFKSETQRVYNLSNGALLNGAEPMMALDVPIEKYCVLDREYIHTEMKSFFDSISSCDFRDEDMNFIRKQLKEAIKLKQTIEKFKKSKFVMPSLYIQALGKLQFELSDMENKTKSDLAHVYYLYFKVVLSYICEIFNTKDIGDVKTHINTVNTILVTQLVKIADTFIITMEEYLNEKQ